MVLALGLSVCAQAATTGQIAWASCVGANGSGCPRQLTTSPIIAMAGSPDGVDLYALTRAGQLLDFSRDGQADQVDYEGCLGALPCTAVEDNSVLTHAAALAVSPDGMTLVVGGTDGVMVFSRTAGMGLTEQACMGAGGTCTSPYPNVVNGVVSLATNANGTLIYAVNAPTEADQQLVSIDNAGTFLLVHDCIDHGTTPVAGCRAAPSNMTGAPVELALAPDASGGYVAAGTGVFGFSSNAGNLSFGFCAGASGCTTPLPSPTGYKHVAVSPDGTNVYAGKDGVLAAFDRYDTGELDNTRCVQAAGMAVGCAATLNNDALSRSSGIAISRDGASIYTGGQQNGNAGGIVGFVRGSGGTPVFQNCIEFTATGSCTALPGGVDAMRDTSALTVSADGRYVDVAAGPGGDDSLLTLARAAPPSCTDSAQQVLAGRTTNLLPSCVSTTAHPVTGLAVNAAPQHGSTGASTASAIPYTPAAGYTGPDAVGYTATNDTGTAAAHTIHVDVLANQNAPTCSDVTTDVPHDTNTSVQLACSFPAGATSSYRVLQTPGHGTLGNIHANGTVTYTPGVDYEGNDSFTYVGHDAAGDSSPATVHLTVQSATGRVAAQGQLAACGNPGEVLHLIDAGQNCNTGGKVTWNDPGQAPPASRCTPASTGCSPSPAAARAP